MEQLLRCVVEQSQTDALTELETHTEVLVDADIAVDCSTLTNHCVCATNFEYFHKPDHLLQCLEKGKCFHCQRYKCMNREHDTVTATTRLILVTAALGKFELLKHLHQKGCSLESKTGIFELRPLHLCVVHGHFNIFCYLMTQKVDVNATILSHGTTYSPLMLAVIHKRDDMVRYLLMARDINVGYRNSLLQSPVMFAVQNDSLHLVNLLLDAEDKKSAKRRTTGPKHRGRVRKRTQHPGALLETLKQDNSTVLQVLLENGCGADYVFKGYHVHISAIVLCAIRNSVKCLDILLQNGAKDGPARDGYTAHAWSKFLNWADCMKLLTKKKKLNKHAKKSACKTVETNCPGPIEVEARAQVKEEADDKDQPDDTAKCSATGTLQTKNLTVTYQYSVPPIIAIWGLVQWMDISDILRRLVEQDHDVNIRDQYGRTSLHLAVEEQSRSGLRTLLQLGANPEIQDACGATPFWHAVYWNKRSMVQELIFANVTMETKAQKDAFKLGVPWQTILAQSANRTAQFRSPLYIALKRGWKMTANLLLEAGYDVKDENIDELLEITKDETLKAALLEHVYQPSTLMDTCRNFVRQQCGLKIHKLVEELDVPARIKDCLLLRSVVDLKIEPVLVHI